jgi:hypothetical protein
MVAGDMQKASIEWQEPAARSIAWCRLDLHALVVSLARNRRLTL